MDLGTEHNLRVHNYTHTYKFCTEVSVRLRDLQYGGYMRAVTSQDVLAPIPGATLVWR